MSVRPFFDTNVLIYSITDDVPRAEISRALLSHGGIVSVQVLSEFVAVARRKLRMSWPDLREALTDVRVLCPGPVSVTLKTHESALKVAESAGYRIYDSLVIAAALESGCDTLYSEDMQDGRRIEGLTIRNPFVH